MPDEVPSTGGWLPPAAPGANPPPRFDAPGWTAPRPAVPPVAEPAGPAGPERDERGYGMPLPPPSATTPAPAGARPRFDAPRRRSNPMAVWGLVLGCAGLTLLLVSLGTLVIISLPLSVGAWVLGQKARSAIAAGESSAGEGQAIAALWLGRAGVIAGVAVAVILIVLVATGFDFEELRRDLERELERQRQEENGGTGGVRSAVEGLRAVIGR
jgi:hypothetical protein